MRIRKNAKISPLLYATSSLNTSTLLQTHNCQLNQSPWDVITTFSPPSSPPPPPPSLSQLDIAQFLFQVNENEVLARNGSSRDSALESMDLQLDDSEEFDVSSQQWEYDSDGDINIDEEEKPREWQGPIFCCKTDGKSWQCRNEAVKGGAMCEHHLSLIRNSCNKKQVGSSTETAKRRSHPKKASLSNPYEFYYYSGFGPRWGKKRGEGNNDNGLNNVGNNLEHQDNDIKLSTLSKFVNEDLDYIDDDDEEDEEHVRKRVRKPIKARSLKSLM